MYLELMERFNEQPDLTAYDSVSEGLARISNERAVMHVFIDSMRGFWRNNPFHQQQLKVRGIGVVNFILN